VRGGAGKGVAERRSRDEFKKEKGEKCLGNRRGQRYSPKGRKKNKVKTREKLGDRTSVLSKVHGEGQRGVGARRGGDGK